MIFDVLKRSVHFSKWEDNDTRTSLNFEVVPKSREYLDIGDKYIVSSERSMFLHSNGREAVSVSISLTSDIDSIAHIKGAKPICGYASFSAEHRGTLDYSPPSLTIVVLVDRVVFDEMLRVDLSAPNTVSLHVRIEGLEYGWEPDGSHQIWKLDDTSDCELGTRRRITSFWCDVETFWTSETAIQDAENFRANAELADSSDPENRKLAAKLQEEEGPYDPVVKLLGQIKKLVLGILALGILALIMMFLQ